MVPTTIELHHRCAGASCITGALAHTLERAEDCTTQENVKKRGAGLEPQGTICGLSLIHGSATMHLSRHHAS